MMTTHKTPAQRHVRQPSRPGPSPDAFAYNLDDFRAMGGPARTKVYELAKSGELKLIRVAGRTKVDGDSGRELLRRGN